MNAHSRVAAIVMLYNSKPDCVEAISTYQHQVNHIYLVDNSEHPNPTLIDQLSRWSNVEYISNGGNKGVAAALNKGAQLAISAGFDFLLTMDDDTLLPSGAVQTMINVFQDSNTTPAGLIGIVSGVHTMPKHAVPRQFVPFTMTSGNLIDLVVYKQVGPFRDEFFIDHVDHEYGLRLNQAGYQVIELPELQLQHQLGERKASGWGSYQFVSHSPVRGYYMVRNGLILSREYPAFRRQLAKLIAKEWLKAILFEDKRWHRIQLLWKGSVDAHYQRLGKLTK